MHGMGWLGIFVALVGVALLIWGIRELATAKAAAAASRTWSSAPGAITESSIVGRGSIEHPAFDPIVRYEYEVGGRKYFGDRLRTGYTSVGTAAAAERMLEPYQINSPVAVRYDPANPGSSVLEFQTTSSVGMMGLGFGALLALMGIALVGGAIGGGFENDRSGHRQGDLGSTAIKLAA